MAAAGKASSIVCTPIVPNAGFSAFHPQCHTHVTPHGTPRATSFTHSQPYITPRGGARWRALSCTRNDTQRQFQRTVAHKLVEPLSTRQGRCNCRRVVGCQLAHCTRTQTQQAPNTDARTMRNVHIPTSHDARITSAPLHTHRMEQQGCNLSGTPNSYVRDTSNSLSAGHFDTRSRSTAPLVAPKLLTCARV